MQLQKCSNHPIDMLRDILAVALAGFTIEGADEVEAHQHAEQEFRTSFRLAEICQSGPVGAPHPVCQFVQGGLGAAAIDFLHRVGREFGRAAQGAHEIEMFLAQEKGQQAGAEGRERCVSIVLVAGRDGKAGRHMIGLLADDRIDQRFAIGIAAVDGHFGDPGQPGDRFHGYPSRPMSEQQRACGCKNGLVLAVIDGPPCPFVCRHCLCP